MSLRITSFDGVYPAEYTEIKIQQGNVKQVTELKGSIWEVSSSILPLEDRDGVYEGRVLFHIVSGNLSNANVALRINIENWSVNNYVLMPAAVYNGNRFRVVKKKYPPMLHEEDGIGVDMPITITDVPHLEKGEGPSCIHLRSGDMATPCIGIHMPEQGMGFQLLADHNTSVGYTGFMLAESDDRRTACVQLEAPAVRKTMYQMCRSDVPSDDKGYDFAEGDRVVLQFRIYEFDCPNIATLYDWYCNTRRDLSGESQLVNMLPFSAAFRIIEDKYMKTQWNENQAYFRVAPKSIKGKYSDWQAGWVGGGMNSLAFLMDGMPPAQKRAKETMNTIFEKLQAPTGYIYPIMYKGKLLGDDFDYTRNKNVLLIRKNADILIFAARHIILLQKRGEQVPELWMKGLEKLADALVRLWNKYGQFGQFIDLDKEEIIVGGTASGGIAPGGLALAYKLLGKREYLDVAVAAGKYYYENYVSKGIMNGGPGEILQCPDSESAFGLLESYVTLYEVTGNTEWLPIAEECAKQCASWCVSYDFSFSEESVFGKLGIRTTGSVYANVQNKHSAPGICTLSGVSLLKLYRATGNKFYLQLCQEIAHNITQYLSRGDRPIKSWDGRYLQAGWMCERVNMSDWEGKKNIGGVFYGSCWCEVSTLLTYNEIPGVWVLADTGEIVVFDHVEAKLLDGGDKWLLTLHNPTDFDAVVKIYVETSGSLQKPWGECALAGCRTVEVAKGGTTTAEIKKQ
jgi:hypothetical protein